jgi:formylglycine-generating enzyme required for sulfatase activity
VTETNVANRGVLPWAVCLWALLLALPARSQAPQGAPDIDQLEKQLETETAKQKGQTPPRPEQKQPAPAPSPPAAKSGAPAGAAPLKWEAAEPYTGPLKLLPMGGARPSFTMGDPTADAIRKSEHPAHAVQLQPFLLGQRAITRGQFQRFVDATGYKTEAERPEPAGGGCVTTDFKMGTRMRGPGHNWRDPGFKQSDDHPVVCVSWTDAQAYIRWVNMETHGRFRLPTEAEWEYAARAGAPAEAELGWSKPGSDLTEDEFCRYGNTGDQTLRLEEARLAGRGAAFHHHWVRCTDGYVYTAPVAKFEMNAFLLHDMNGNVSVWVEDCWHEDFTGAPTDGSAWQSKDAKPCEHRVVRGSSWASLPRELRISHRQQGLMVARADTLGFRLAMTP